MAAQSTVEQRVEPGEETGEKEVGRDGYGASLVEGRVRTKLELLARQINMPELTCSLWLSGNLQTYIMKLAG